jgi:hypothetical protein
MAFTTLPREWWAILIVECVNRRIVNAALTASYLAGAYELLTGHPDRGTLLRVALDDLLDRPAGEFVPNFYRCGGSKGPIVIRRVTQQQVAKYSFGYVHPPAENAPPHAVIDDEVWAENGRTVGTFKGFLISQYGDFVARQTFTRNPKGEFVGFETKDKKAITATVSIIQGSVQAQGQTACAAPPCTGNAPPASP